MQPHWALALVQMLLVIRFSLSRSSVSQFLLSKLLLQQLGHLTRSFLSQDGVFPLLLFEQLFTASTLTLPG